MLTKSYEEMVKARVQIDPKFRRALLRGVLSHLLHLEFYLTYKTFRLWAYKRKD